MKCEELQFNLPLYIDDCLSSAERAALEAHLPKCPLCRQKLSEYKDLRSALRLVPRPAVPADLLRNVRAAVAARAAHKGGSPVFAPLFAESLSERVRHFLMPYTVAVFASVFIGVSLFFVIDAPDVNPLEAARIAPPAAENASPVILANSDFERVREDLGLDPAAGDFQTISLTDTPPSINPAGALVALTKSFVRGKMKDEEVVIVADVFSSGIARVSEVVEPPKDERILLEIQEALEKNPDEAPFLPAKADNRSDKVTFIFKIQRVDVVDDSPKRKHRKQTF